MKRIPSALLLVLILVASACESKPAPSHAAASEVTHPIAETALPVVRLSAEAISRLRIETTTVRQGSVPRTRLVGGEVVVPPGRTVTITAPVAGEDDDGPGVEASERERAFEPFFRSSEALRRRVPGHGLGLALIRHIATTHGGSATLVDKRTQGARLEIRLPSAG
jgi:nitrogen-specific signal transduction histidine kinase